MEDKRALRGITLWVEYATSRDKGGSKESEPMIYRRFSVLWDQGSKSKGDN